MKDSNGITLETGDLLLVTFNVLIDENSIKIVFKSLNDDGTITYYPLTNQGLQVAKYDAGESQTGMYRTAPFKLVNIESNNIIKIEEGVLDSNLKRIYNQIITRL